MIRDLWYDLKDLDDEIWKDVIGFEGLYQVSNFGRVKSLERYTENRHIHVKEKILKQGKNSNNYYMVVLCKKSKKFSKKVHRLVAEAFIPNPENKPNVNHKKIVTKDICDNRVDNLEWVTDLENVRYSMKLKNFVNPPTWYGKDNNASKRIYQFTKNGEFMKEWSCVREVCEHFNIERHSLRNHILNNKMVSGYIFKYKTEGGDCFAGDNNKHYTD